MTRKLIFVAPFPPEHHGQAVSSQKLFSELEERLVNFNIRRVDSNKKSARYGSLQRVFTMVAAFFIVLWAPFSAAIYLSLNARKGMLFSLVLALISRIKKQKLLIHHHTYSHISNYSSLFNCLAKCAGNEALHITICDQMSYELMSKYPADVKNCMAISNTSSVEDNLLSIDLPLPPFKSVGFMSNLTREKGLISAIETFERAKQKGLVEKLYIAGPLSDGQLALLIENKKKKHGDSFCYLGAVYGEEKKKFFASIDVFIFPSKYINETQGIVNLEAMASGRPVVAYGKCCIPSDLEGSGGISINENLDFAGEFVAYLEDQKYGDNLHLPRKRFNALCEQHYRQITNLIEFIKQEKKCQLP